MGRGFRAVGVSRSFWVTARQSVWEGRGREWGGGLYLVSCCSVWGVCQCVGDLQFGRVSEQHTRTCPLSTHARTPTRNRGTGRRQTHWKMNVMKGRKISLQHGEYRQRWSLKVLMALPYGGWDGGGVGERGILLLFLLSFTVLLLITCISTVWEWVY